jgi:hypothetical protein
MPYPKTPTVLPPLILPSPKLQPPSVSFIRFELKVCGLPWASYPNVSAVRSRKWERLLQLSLESSDDRIAIATTTSSDVQAVYVLFIMS